MGRLWFPNLRNFNSDRPWMQKLWIKFGHQPENIYCNMTTVQVVTFTMNTAVLNNHIMLWTQGRQCLTKRDCEMSTTVSSIINSLTGTQRQKIGEDWSSWRMCADRTTWSTGEILDTILDLWNNLLVVWILCEKVEWLETNVRMSHFMFVAHLCIIQWKVSERFRLMMIAELLHLVSRCCRLNS